MLIPGHEGGTTVWSRWEFVEDLRCTGASFRNKVDNAAARFLSLSEGHPLESTSSKPNASSALDRSARQAHPAVNTYFGYMRLV
jgi:hypothetical protein